ncbi:paraquat-inducible protein A [Conservatibacter flavescens]|uniref:Paraquat-inducible membrane protein A n=1 Tax=Conservatibacter flavescens TaxID=28161 RepID=A0A2M8S5Z1_9PAST|nr:paraquat-inducible protein A [Conservatibacter flavescens]PJG86575.1 hypothetical protein CVP05_01855 [Conservatibacter flavescens]
MDTTAPQNTFHQLTHCTECGALVSVPNLVARQTAECPRCHHTLKSADRWSLKRCAFIALSILILMPFALKFPLISINLLGSPIHASVWDGVWKMATAGFPYTAFLVFLCAIVTPVFFALLVLLLRISQMLNIKPRNVLLTINYLKPWVMLDVYLVSIGVAAFKVREYADLHIDIYLIAFVFTALLTTLLFIKINPKALWNDFYPEHQHIQNMSEQNALCCCTNCEYSFEHAILNRKNQPTCPRCLHRINIDDSLILQGTWATLIAGIIMLIPANLLPISSIYLAGAPSADTLMSGVISFINMGSYFVAFVVFTASIFVPISKILIMIYLLLSVHFQWRHSIKWQMRLLHIVHFVGRWSMLDLFVLALMMSLVTRGQIITFSVGPAALYFGAAVFLTMISTSLFDSRLLWKIYDKQYSNTGTKH